MMFEMMFAQGFYRGEFGAASVDQARVMFDVRVHGHDVAFQSTGNESFSAERTFDVTGVIVMKRDAVDDFSFATGSGVHACWNIDAFF